MRKAQVNSDYPHFKKPIRTPHVLSLSDSAMPSTIPANFVKLTDPANFDAWRDGFEAFCKSRHVWEYIRPDPERQLWPRRKTGEAFKDYWWHTDREENREIRDGHGDVLAFLEETVPAHYQVLYFTRQDDTAEVRYDKVRRRGEVGKYMAKKKNKTNFIKAGIMMDSLPRDFLTWIQEWETTMVQGEQMGESELSVNYLLSTLQKALELASPD
ncbi:hypothetical protein F5Y17DRAFT_89675 [Xylariaceae sp. FL0594]|nr:hypothetical protein F5Y17DRAFT_89675 [Xylariaceae sp. FL0594]